MIRPAGEAAREAAGDAAALLRAIAAAPRPPGSATEGAARQRCAAALQALGFQTVERPFVYSSVPGVYGAPLVGAVLAAAGIVAAEGVRRGRPRTGAAAGIGVAAAGAIGAAWLLRAGTERIPLARRRSVNLEGRRGSARGACGREPAVWLVAHLDSKSQAVSLAARAAGAVGSVAVWGAMAGTLAAGRSDRRTVAALGAIAVAAALPLVRGRAGEQSAGALDNASGVATILEAAARLPGDLPLGVLLTSAEEHGLAGARAWLASRPEAAPGMLAVNCDGVDDAGPVVCIVAGDRHRLLDRVLRDLERHGIRRRSRLPGVLFDAVAFSDAGWSAVTVSRGGWRSLRRVHTPADDLAHLRGAGVSDAAAVVAALALGAAGATVGGSTL